MLRSTLPSRAGARLAAAAPAADGGPAPALPPGWVAPRAATIDTPPPLAAPWLLAALDELACPLVLLRADGTRLHANRAARMQGPAPGIATLPAPLGTTPAAAWPRWIEAQDAASATASGTPSSPGDAAAVLGWLLTPLEAPDGTRAGLLVGQPMPGNGPDDPPVLARFAAHLGFTPAETRVLRALCRGDEPIAIARQLGVSVATVRSQLAALRRKSGHGRLTALLHEVGALPPLVPAVVQAQPPPGTPTQAAGTGVRREQRPSAPRGSAAAMAALAPWLAPMLDALDLGLLLVDGGGRLAYANDCARRPRAGAGAAVEAAEATAGLAVSGQGLRVHPPEAADPLRQALAAARRGRGSLMRLGQATAAVGLAVLPLPGRAVLLLQGAAVAPAAPALRAYAAHLRLTAAETRVLSWLARGVEPRMIARDLGVALSTVRTQIGHLRAKSGAPSIRELVRRVATLPPVAAAADAREQAR